MHAGDPSTCDRAGAPHPLPVWVGPALCIGYYLAARLGMALAFQPDFISALWPANCVLLTALLLTEPRRWIWLLPATIPAELLADLPAGLSVLDSMHFLAGDWTEALIAAWAMRCSRNRPILLTNLRAASCFVACAVLLAPAVAGLIMAATVGPGADTVSFVVRWRRWFLGDALAQASITPLLLSLATGRLALPARRSAGHILEGLLLFIILALLAAISFGAFGLELSLDRGWSLLPYPVLIYAAVRFGPRVSFASFAVLAIVGVWAATHGELSLPAGEADAYVADFQVALLLAVLPAMLLAALMEERRVANAALAQDEQRLEGILDSLGVGVLAVDSRGGAILYANPAAARLIGRPAEAIAGMKLAMLLPLQAPDREPLRPGEQELRRADGQSIPVLVTQTQTRLRGHTCVLASLTDLTLFKQAERERARLQDELRHAAKMESIGRLAGGVAHDFNNFLQVVGGHLTLAEETIPAQSPAQAHLREIGAATARAGRVVRQLLAFGRRHAMRVEPVELNPLIERLAGLLRSTLGESVQLRCELGRDVPAIQADPHLVEQAIFSLCTNAREAMPEGGRLLLATSAATLAEDDLRGHADARPGLYARVLVCDSGRGMDAATRERMFEPFFSTKTGAEAAGLGLAGVYGIVKQHDGVIRVQSEPGAGTAICLYLPAEERAATPGASPAATPVTGGSETVLFAEDDADVRELACTMLRHAGYRVLVAADGEEAFAIFRRHSREVDLLVLDVLMPGRGGRETAQLVHREAPDLPILLTSGYGEALARGDAGAEKHERFLAKPHSREELLRAVRAALDAAPGGATRP